MEKHATGLKGGRSQHCQFVYSKRQFSHLPTPPTRFIRSTSHRTTKLTEAPTICVKSARTKFDKLKNRLPPGRRIAATARALVPQRQIDMAPLISSLLPDSRQKHVWVPTSPNQSRMATDYLSASSSPSGGSKATRTASICALQTTLFSFVQRLMVS